FPLASGESAQHAGEPKITSSGEGLDAAMLSDGDLEKTTKVPIPELGAQSWIQFEYDSPRTMRALTYVTKDPGFNEKLINRIAAPDKALEASDDGQKFHKIASLSGGRAAAHTISFAPVTAKFFRVSYKRMPPPPVPPWAEGLDPASFGITPPPRP